MHIYYSFIGYVDYDGVLNYHSTGSMNPPHHEWPVCIVNLYMFIELIHCYAIIQQKPDCWQLMINCFPTWYA